MHGSDAQLTSFQLVLDNRKDVTGKWYFIMDAQASIVLSKYGGMNMPESPELPNHVSRLDFQMTVTPAKQKLRILHATKQTPTSSDVYRLTRVQCTVTISLYPVTDYMSMEYCASKLLVQGPPQAVTQY